MALLVILGDREMDILRDGGCVFTQLDGKTVGIVTDRAICKIVEYTVNESEDEQQ